MQFSLIHETKKQIPSSIIPMIIESLRSGTQFSCTDRQWTSINRDDIYFTCRCKIYSNIVYVKLSNDERRRLLPILLKQQ